MFSGSAAKKDGSKPSGTVFSPPVESAVLEPATGWVPGALKTLYQIIE